MTRELTKREHRVARAFEPGTTTQIGKIDDERAADDSFDSKHAHAPSFSGMSSLDGARRRRNYAETM